MISICLPVGSMARIELLGGAAGGGGWIVFIFTYNFCRTPQVMLLRMKRFHLEEVTGVEAAGR
jgi:hypothetical protein